MWRRYKVWRFKNCRRTKTVYVYLLIISTYSSMVLFSSFVFRYTMQNWWFQMLDQVTPRGPSENLIWNPRTRCGNLRPSIPWSDWKQPTYAELDLHQYHCNRLQEQWNQRCQVSFYLGKSLMLQVHWAFSHSTITVPARHHRSVS